jgi:hypothetical protein
MFERNSFNILVGRNKVGMEQLTASSQPLSLVFLCPANDHGDKLGLFREHCFLPILLAEESS